MSFKSILSGIGKAAGAVGSLIGGPLVSAAGNVIGSLIGANAQKKNNESLMELAQYKYDKDLEQWNRENAYNTPTAQMQRYADAGLNPNLIYGQGSSGNASGGVSYDAPNLQAYTNYGDMGASGAVHAFQQQQAINSQVALQNANSELSKSQRNMVDAQIVGQNLKNLNQTIQNSRDYFEYGIRTKYGDDMANAQLQNSWQALHTSQSQQQLNLANASLANAREDLTLRQIDTEIARKDLTEAQTKEVKQRVMNLKAQLGILEFELQSNPDPQMVKLANEANQTFAKAWSDWLNDKILYSKFIDVFKELGGVIGSALSGYRTFKTTPFNRSSYMGSEW